MLFFTTALQRSGGGLYEAVSGLASKLAAIPNVSVTVAGTTTDRLQESEKDSWGAARLLVRDGASRLRRALALRHLADSLRPTDYDVVHAHGLWDGASAAAARWAKQNRKPLVISPHGMLDPWSFRHHRVKKLLPWLLWERSLISQACVIDTKSIREAEHVRARGFNNETVVIPIGINAPDVTRTSKVHKRTRHCLFLSRIHPVKGIENLIAAWEILRPRGWRLTIAGDGDNSYVAKILRLITGSVARESISYRGPVYNEDKWALLRSSDLFVLPSKSENFGIVVAEALSQAIPVIASTETPWIDLTARNCGWQTPPTASALARTLSLAVSLPQSQLWQMGINGKTFAFNTFSWESVSQKTLELYRSVADIYCQH